MNHQIDVLNATEGMNRVAYYLDMGLGKTYVGSEKAVSLHKNILVICQKSKIDDWMNHFVEYYGDLYYLNTIANLTNEKALDAYIHRCENERGLCIGIINYELAWRRKKLSDLTDFTLMLDESSLIQNENAKRSKFILKDLKPSNVILLSGTPTSGRYERLWSQLHLLGWDITKTMYWNHYVTVRYQEIYGQRFPIKIVTGYKNVDRLKTKLREHGCQFLKTEEVMNLPLQNFQEIKIQTTKEYSVFKKDRIVRVDDKELVGDTVLTRMLYERMLCGQYNEYKLEALKDLLESTEDRVIIFYSFNEELDKITSIVKDLDRPVSIVNGQTKDLKAYETHQNSVTLVQYQAGAMGLNLQKANKIVYFTPPLSSELYEQSKKRIHRIGQERPCFYYNLICKNSIEPRIYEVLAMRKDYTDKLFEGDEREQR